MKIIAASLVAAAILVLANPARANDAEEANKLGFIGKTMGYATDYKIDVWNQNIDLTISSMLPGDARDIGQGMCMYAQQHMTFDTAWHLRVFLVVGDRPASVCDTRLS